MSMRDLKLTIMPSGKAVLSTQDDLSAEQVRVLQDAWQRFVEAEPPELLIVSGEVRVLDVEITDGDLRVLTESAS